MKSRSIYQYSRLFSLLAFLLFLTPLSAAPKKEEEKKPLVFINTIQHSEIFDLLTYPARVTAKINASILSETDGVVKKILTPLGKPVRRNQKLMVLTNTDPIYNYAPITVRASVSGVISKIAVTEGSRVTKGQQLAQITDPSQIRIEVEVAVSDLSSIRAGLEGMFSTNSFEKPFPIKVLGVSPYVDPGTGTATAELNFTKKSDTTLPPGLVGKVIFKAREHQGFQIPEHAIYYMGRDPIIHVVSKGKVKYTPVTLGQSRQGLVEILKGLQKDMTVVVRANKFVADGEEVEVQKKKEMD